MTAVARVLIVREKDLRTPFVVQAPLREPYRDAAQDIRAAAESMIELIVRDGLTAALLAD